MNQILNISCSFKLLQRKVRSVHSDCRQSTPRFRLAYAMMKDGNNININSKNRRLSRRSSKNEDGSESKNN